MIKPFDVIYEKLKQVVGDPTDETWFAISDDFHLSYDPTDPIAAECVSFLIFKENLDCPELIKDWLSEKESFFRENLNHIYEAKTMEDYEELVLSGMEDRPYIRTRLQTMIPDGFSYDTTYDRIKNEIHVTSQEYAENKMHNDFAYYSTLVFGSKMVTCFLGVILICVGAYFIYRDYGYYQWAMHIVKEYPSISQDYMTEWTTSCRFGGIYILGGIANVFFPFALSQCEDGSFYTLGKFSKYAGLILLALFFVLLITMGSDFFLVCRPLD